MPDLPTLTIPAGPSFDRVYAAFGGDPAAYRKWLRQAVISEVTWREANAVRAGAEQQIQTITAELKVIGEAT